MRPSQDRVDSVLRYLYSESVMRNMTGAWIRLGMLGLHSGNGRQALSSFLDKRFDEVMFRLDQSDARARNRDIFKASQSIQYVPHVGRKALEKPKGFPDTVAKFWGLKRCRESLQISSPYSNSLLPKPNTSRHCATSIDTLTTRHELLNR